MKTLLSAKGPQLLFILLWMVAAFSALPANMHAQSIPLQKIEAQVMQGKLQGLRQLAPYLDSQKQVIEYLGYHRLETTEAAIASRIIAENSLFKFSQDDYGKSLSEAEFLDFLKAQPVRWCDTLAAFVHEPWRKTDVQYRLRGLTQDQIAERSKDIQSLDPNWVLLKHWDEMLRQKDPRLMPEIAAECFRNRHRFNRYHPTETFVTLLEACTHLQIAFQKSDGAFSFDLDEFDKTGLLNLLNFWLTNYPAFRWNPQQDCFTSSQFPSPNPMQEADLFKALESEDDAVAYAAFVALAQGDPEVVTTLAGEHSDIYSLNTNRCLGTFPYRYLMQLPWMVQYCRNHQVDYLGSKQMQDGCVRLAACNNTRSCRTITQEMLASMQLSDATALEYWAITHSEKYWAHGAITWVLDQLYTRHWRAILSDPAQLELYLRKADWFEHLGIIGSCNNYLRKFIAMPKETVTSLDAIPDPDKQLQSLIDSAKVRLQVFPREKPLFRGKNAPNRSKNLRKDFENAIQKGLQKNNTNFFEATQVITQIAYNQIAEAIALVEQDTLIEYSFPEQRYDFIENDFGIPADSLLDPRYRQDFLQCFATMTEYELYRHYLRKSGLDFEKTNGELDFDKVYGVLEFELAEEFMGGSIPSSNAEVYSMVKLLEIHFGTRLNFPEKLCSHGSYTFCSAREWAQAWMQYLEEKGIVNRDPWRPRSFGYEY